jgi:chromosome segregation ATPase
MAKQQSQPSREAQVIQGLNAFEQTVSERDHALNEVNVLSRRCAELEAALNETRGMIAMLLRDRDVLTNALATANSQMRTVHSCMRDMANVTEKAVESAKAIDHSGAEAMARRLAPPVQKDDQMVATLADRIAAAGQNGNSQAVQK